MLACLINRGRFAKLLLPVMGRLGLSQIEFADRLGVPDRTLRNWLNEDRSPAVDWLLYNAHKLPDEVLVAVLQELAGDRYVIEPTARPGVTSCVQGQAIGLTFRTAAFSQAVHLANEDGLITPAEACTLIGHVMTIIGECRGILHLLRTIVTGAAHGLMRRPA